MVDNQSLRDALRPVARAVRTADERQKEAAVFAAFDAAGGVKAEALQRSLPPLMLTWWLPGSVVAGSNVGMEVTLERSIRLTSISLRAKTPPAGGACQVRLTANGGAVESAAIQSSSSFGRSVISSDAAHRAAGETLRLDVIAVSGAADITVVVTYTVAE